MLTRSYSAGPKPGSLSVVNTLEVDRDRQLIFAPMLVLLPGAAADGTSFGRSKAQALLSGLEYLGRDDASSSEADVIGPASNRRVPDSLKLTIPLMALSAEGRYVAIRGVPSEVLLTEDDGMKTHCAVNLHNVVTVTQNRLGKRVAQLSSLRMAEICAALRFSLGCDGS